MKKFIAGLGIGLMLTSTVSFAANQDISAVLTDFNFIVNGQAKALSTRPIVYNGTSYLPVRELANILEYNVEYNAETRTIILTNRPHSGSLPDQHTSEVSDLISVDSLIEIYGVEMAFAGNSGDPVVLTYKDISIKTTDYVIIDSRMYFKKDILTTLNIN